MQPSIWSEFKKYLGDALPGGALNPELTTDVNESPVPVGMAALRSFLGEAPDQLGVSALHPQRAAIMRAAEPAFAAGTALQVAPILGGLSALKSSRGTVLSAAPRNVDGALSRQAGVFVGPKSKTWNKAAAQRAVEMETAGIDPRDIWRETGTWRGPEGILRQEIDDSKARIRDYFFTPRDAYENALRRASGSDEIKRAWATAPYAEKTLKQLKDEYATTGEAIIDAALSGDKELALKLSNDRSGLSDLMSYMRNRVSGPVSSYLAHGDLGQAYPDLYRMHVRVDPMMTPRGAYMRADPTRVEQINIQSIPTFSSDKSTMLHELQHPIQQREGFGRGGNPGMFPTPLINDAKTIADELAQGVDRMTINRWFKSTYGRSPDPAAWDLAEHPMIDRMVADDPVENYARLAGEAEARAVQARMKMAPEERRAIYPPDSYDRPIDQLILHATEGPIYSGYARGGLAQLKECSCGK